jgi:hypothetical protein
MAFLGKKILASEMMHLDQREPYTTIDIDDAGKWNTWKSFEEHIQSIQYIPLYTEEPIGVIDKVVIYNEKIYVLDAFKQEKIFIFDMSGKLQKIISDKGQGPQEYHGLDDMNIDKLNNELVINDRLAPYMLYYDLNGNFLRKEKSLYKMWFVPYKDMLITYLTDGQSFDDNVNFNILVTKGDSVIKRAFPIYPLQFKNVNNRSLSLNYKDDILFRACLSDTVYHIMSDSSYCVKYVVKHPKSIWSKHDEPIGVESDRLIINDGYSEMGDLGIVTK